MQSRRRFFCARVELVQLARAFLCSSTEPRRDDEQRDRAQEPQPRDSGAQVDRAAPGASCTIYPRPQPPQRAHKATQPGKGTGTQASPETGHRAAHSGAQAQAIHSPGNNTAGNAHKRPTEPPRAGVLSLYYSPPKRPTAAHRAAHRGQASGGTETPGRASPQPPQPRHSTPGKNPGDFL